MNASRPIWLVNNASSGSNDDAALAALETACGEHGFRVAHRTVFPEQELPTVEILDAAGIDRLAVFAGDGTINTVIAGLAGWGCVLRKATDDLESKSRRDGADSSGMDAAFSLW